MDVSYHPSEDIVSLFCGNQNYDCCEALTYDQGVALGYAEEGSYEVVYVEVIGISRWVKAGYDAETDTLALGCDPAREFRVVESGEFVSYREKVTYSDDDVEWEPVKLEIRNASRHLAEVFAHLGLSPGVDLAEGQDRPPDAG